MTAFEEARKRLRTYPHRIDNADAGLIDARITELEAENADLRGCAVAWIAECDKLERKYARSKGKLTRLTNYAEENRQMALRYQEARDYALLRHDGNAARIAELEAEVALQRALVDEALDLSETVEADRVLATNARLMGLLRSQEWCIGTDRSWCHHCRRYRDDGHTADCPIPSALEASDASNG